MPLPANVAIDDIVPITFATGNGVTAEYPFTWWVDDESNIDVYVGESARAAFEAGPKTLGTHYTVTLATEPAVGGTVIFGPGFEPSDDYAVVLVRSMPLERLTDFPSAGKLESRVLNSDLDAIVAMIQQMRLTTARSLQHPITSNPAAFDAILPTPETGKAMKWTSGGGLENYDPAFGPTLASVDGGTFETPITPIALRRGSPATRRAVVLADGEPGWDTNDNFYIGDGVKLGGQPITQPLGVFNVSHYESVGAAFDAAIAAGGGTILFPAGVWDVSGDTLTAPVPLTLVGMGREFTIVDGGVQGTADVEPEGINVTAAFAARGIHFRNMGAVCYLRDVPADTVLDYIDIQDCKFTNTGGAVYWNDLNVPDSGIGRVVATNNVVEDSARGFFIGCEIIRESLFQGNTIKNVIRKALQIGVNLPVDREDPVDDNYHRVIGNYIDGVSDEAGIAGIYESNGILVHGQYAVIANNVVKNVTTFDNNNCEGIYTKCRNSVITGNVLVDAGWSQGSISIKGSRRNKLRQPWGYSVICANNQIYSTGGANFIEGIYATTDDILLQGNMSDGLAGPGILVFTDPTDEDDIINNITVRGNTVTHTRGKFAIVVEAQVNGLIIENNVIDTITDEFAATGGIGSAISLNTYAGYAGGIQNVRIRGNVIRDIAAGLQQGRAIWVVKDSTDVVANVDISDNDIDGVYQYGIAISGDTAISGLRVTRNRVKNVTTANGDIARTGSADYSAAGAVIEGNYGDFVNEAEGIATLVNGQTFVAVTHGCSTFGVLGTPLAQDIIVTPIESWGSATKYWVDTIGPSTFRINVNADPGQDVDFAWRVRRRVWQT